MTRHSRVLLSGRMVRMKSTKFVGDGRAWNSWRQSRKTSTGTLCVVMTCVGLAVSACQQYTPDTVIQVTIHNDLTQSMKLQDCDDASCNQMAPTDYFEQIAAGSATQENVEGDPDVPSFVLLTSSTKRLCLTIRASALSYVVSQGNAC